MEKGRGKVEAGSDKGHERGAEHTAHPLEARKTEESCLLRPFL